MWNQIKLKVRGQHRINEAPNKKHVAFGSRRLALISNNAPHIRSMASNLITLHFEYVSSHLFSIVFFSSRCLSHSAGVTAFRSSTFAFSPAFFLFFFLFSFHFGPLGNATSYTYRGKLEPVARQAISSIVNFIQNLLHHFEDHLIKFLHILFVLAITCVVRVVHTLVSCG